MNPRPHPEVPADARGPWVAFSSLRVRDLLLWYALGALLVHIVPSMWRLGGPPWTLPLVDQIQSWYWTSAFLLAAFSLTLWRAVHGGISLPWLAILTAGPWAFCFAVLTRRDDVALSRMVALMSGGLGTLMLLAPAVVGMTRVPRAAIRVVASVAVVAGLVLGVSTATASRGERHSASGTAISTSLMPVTIHYDSSVVPDPQVPGGAIVRLGRGLLLVTGAGEWYDVGWDSTGQHLQASALDLPAPMARENVEFEGAYPPLMRVEGLAVDMRDDTASVWVVHEVWEPTERCLAVQVSTIRLYRLKAMEKSWRQIYRTQPCLRAAEGFDPYDSGGRITILPDHSLLVTVGDYGMTHVAGGELAQLQNTDYGKTILIGPDGRRTLHTMGHRNPNGITVDRDGNVWVAEQGPRGGDELNLLRSGANYGWPLATYGTDYGSFRWRIAPSATNSFTEPALVFVPSIAISNVIAVEGRLFEPWSGDLLAGSLAAQELQHIRRIGTRAIYAEPIPLRIRVRDLVETEDGRIVIWNDDGHLVWLAPASAILEGTLAFESCIRCHGTIDEGDPPLAPSLGGIVDRPVASNPDFVYSEALKRVGGRWTEDRLDAFVRSPSEFAPGTRMAFPGIADSTTRKALIGFLRRSVRVGGD